MIKVKGKGKVEMSNPEILIVEGAEEIIWSVSNVMEKAGFSIEAVTTGKDALEWIGRNSQIGVVIINYLLSDMSGLELLKRLRKDGHNIKIIALSSYGEIREDFMKNGAYAFIEKPFDINELVKICRRALNGRNDLTGLPS